MLRKLRIALALLFFAGITLLFVGIGQDWWGWMAKIQLLPAVYRIVGGAVFGNIAIVAAILLLTLLLGRIYCSVVCPLGIFQDVVMWLRRQIGLGINKINVRKAKKYASERKEKPAEDVEKPVTLKPIVKHFGFSPERGWLRWTILAVIVVSLFVIGQLLISLVAPYSAYGRMVQAICGLAGGTASSTLVIVAAATFVILALCAWFWGRIWCNTICPVGTVLGYVAKFSLFKIRIDADKCKACGRCGRGCKSSCIDMDAHKVDYSRCVDCFDCIGRCKEGAIVFSLKDVKKMKEIC